MNSIVYSLWKTSWSCTNPIIFFRIHIFSFPLNSCIVSAWCWPYFYDLFFIRAIISEFCISSKSTFEFFLLWKFFRRNRMSIKSIKRNSTRRIWRGTRHWPIFFCKVIITFSMLVNPEFIICSVHFEVSYFIMRIMKSWPWCYIRIKLSIFIKITFLAIFMLFCT